MKLLNAGGNRTSTLKFRKFKVDLNPTCMYRIFLKFAKSCVLSCLSIFHDILHTPFFNYKPGHFIAMVTYCYIYMKVITTNTWADF